MERYIQEKLLGLTGGDDVPNQTFMQDDPALLLVCQDPVEDMDQDEDEYEDEEEETEAEEVAESLKNALREYGEKVAALLTTNPKDKSTLKAAKAMTRTLVKAQRSNPHTIQQQMHGFGAGGAAARRTRSGQIIKPNPPAIAARMAPGSMPAPLGRRFKDRSGEVATTQEGEVVLADNPPAYRDRRPHNLSLAVSKNIPNAK